MLSRSLAIFAIAAATFAGSGDSRPVPARSTVKIAGRPLNFSAKADWTDVTLDGEKAKSARIFSTSYAATGPHPRPIAFVWNGGPGAPSSWLQFVGIGPYQIDGFRFGTNADTILPTTDLVFVDPVGTGFSRLIGDGAASSYFSTTGDARAATQFILAWLRTHRAESRPIFLIGESFGVFRAGGVAERLESQGQRVAGVVLISGGAASGPLIPPTLRTALRVPQLAIGALALHKSDPTLGQDEGQVSRAAAQWATTVYLPALARLDSLDESERRAVRHDLSRFTGYPEDRIDRSTLVVGRDYLQLLSPNPDLPLSEMDMRTTHIPRVDAATVAGFYRKLGIRTKLAYWQTDAIEAGHPSEQNWINDYRWPESARWGADYAEPWLPAAMKYNPGMKVFIATGIYDFLNSCVEHDVLRGMLNPDLARNYTMRCYRGGHLIYRDREARSLLGKDISEFIGGVVNAEVRRQRF